MNPSRKPRVLVDVDGVLADFVTAALSVVRRVTGEPATEDAIQDWDLFRAYPKDVQKKFYNVFKSAGWCYSLNPYPGAVEGIQLLRQRADVYFVTAPMHGPYWSHERTQWLIDYFDAEHHHIVHTHAKYLCVGDILIDDKIDHVAKWKLHHMYGHSLLWDQPYNQSAPESIQRVSSWIEVNAILGYLTRVYV